MVTITLFGDLNIFLPWNRRTKNPFETVLERRTSIKDLLEAHGIPHPEIYTLIVNGQETGFDHIVADHDQIGVAPFPCPVDLAAETFLRSPVKKIAFVVDVNVLKLARLLRMAGFDTLCNPMLDDEELAQISCREERILLTRDRALLKRKVVVHGRIIRNDQPAEQLKEIISLYALRDRIRPFSRCLDCNDFLLPVSKNEIVERLEPLTERYFDDFHICPVCNRIFWPGSHRDNMLSYLKGL